MTTQCCFMAIRRLFEGLRGRESEWHAALEWTQQQLEGARIHRSRRQWREAEVNKLGVQRWNRSVPLWYSLRPYLGMLGPVGSCRVCQCPLLSMADLLI